MTYPVIIVAIVVDAHNLTMYKSDGDTITIPQGDPRLRDLVAKMAPVIDTGKSYLLTSEDMDGKNHYAETEKKTNGLIRFFKMAKSKFKEIAEKFCEPVEPMAVGKLPVMEHTVGDSPVIADLEPVKPKLPPEDERPLTQGLAAVAEIMANAKPSSDKDFASVTTAQQAKDNGTEEEIVVAVTSDNTVIHGVEQLSDQMKAVSAGVTSGNGMARFLERAASVKRGHSVEDLLKFVQKGELPFADDGTVLVYKRLKPGKKPGVFVDVYSGKVEQSLGSFVHMAADLVDARRSVDCSNGLHVARRDYLHAFSGDVVVLCKLAPEHVIAVPTYDARKLRAMGYHIIAQLNDEDARLVCRNQPMKDTELLANAIAGNHLPILEYVEITQSMGGGLKVTKVESPEQHAASQVRAASSLDEIPEVSPEASQVDARALALDLGKPSAAQLPAGGMTVKSEPIGEATPVPAPAKVTAKRPIDVLVQAFRNAVGNPAEQLAAARDLAAFKKQSKKAWTALGVSIDDYETAMELVNNANTKVASTASIAEQLPKAVPPNDNKHFPILGGDNSGLPAKPVKVKKAAPPIKQPAVKAKDTPVVKATKVKVKSVETIKDKPAVEQVKGKRSQKEEAAHLLDIYTKNPDYINCKQLVAFKRGTKKGWSALGIDEADGKKAEARVKV